MSVRIPIINLSKLEQKLSVQVHFNLPRKKDADKGLIAERILGFERAIKHVSVEKISVF